MKKALNSLKVGRRGIGDFSNTLFCYKKQLSLIFLLLIVLAVILIPIKVLLASDYKTGKYLKSWSIEKKEEFYVEYTHSVQLTPVIEIYFIDENYNIVLKESYFHSYGAGLPATTEYNFEITDNGFRIYNINQIIEELIYRTGAEKANHKISVRDKIYPFLDFSAPRAGVKFSVERLSLLSYLAKEVLQ